MAQKLNVPPTVDNIIDGLDMAEILFEGLTVWTKQDDRATQIRSVFALAELRQRAAQKGEADRLIGNLDREECLREGVCPDCGDEAKVKRDGTYSCRYCGEV